MLREQRRFKGEDTQHMVHGAANFLYPLWPPSPNRWADKMHRFNALCTQTLFNTQVKVRRIHTHKNPGLVCEQALHQLFADAQDPPDTLD